MTLTVQSSAALKYESIAAAAGIALIGTNRATSAQNGTPSPMAASQLGLPEPGTREGEFLETNGDTRIFYQVTGEGEPMLLLHDYPLSGALFERNPEPWRYSRRSTR